MIKLFRIAVLLACPTFGQMNAPSLDRAFANIDALEKKASSHATDPELRYRLGRAYQRLAALCLENMQAYAQHSARMYQAIGESLSIQGETKKAVETFLQAAEADPRLAGTHLALAILYDQEGRREEAVKEVERELALAPESANALEFREKLKASTSNALAAPQSPPAAAESADAPRHARLLARVVQAPLDAADRATVSKAIEDHDYVSAERLLVERIEQNPNSPELLAAAAGLFFLDRQFLNVAIALKKAEKLAPLVPEDRYLLAMAYIALQHSDWARPELDKLAAAEPNNPMYQYWLARIDYDERRYTDAVGRLQRVVALEPRYVRAWDNLGLALEGLGRLDETAEAYGKATELNRADATPSVWPPLNFGTLLIRQDRIAEALPLLNEALKYAPKSAQVHYRLGLAHEKTGDVPAAIRELRESASLDNSYAEPLYVLARLFYKQGDTAHADEAMQAFKRIKAATRGGTP
jgi:tetratricopeptide (TPR) repeat protein